AVGDALPALLAVAGAAWALVLMVARLPSVAAPRLAAAGLIGAAGGLVGMLAPRGGAGSDPLPAAVVPLAGAAAGLAVALVLPALWRVLARAAPRRRPFARVALLELARD